MKASADRLNLNDVNFTVLFYRHLPNLDPSASFRYKGKAKPGDGVGHLPKNCLRHSAYLQAVGLSDSLIDWLFIYSFIDLFILFIYLFIYLSIYLFIHSFIHPSIYLFIYLFIHLLVFVQI